MDLIGEIDAARRRVRTGDHDGTATREVVITRTYDTTVEDLWDALTTAERIGRWLMPVSGDLHLGGRYQLEGNAEGEITACEPPTSFTATWEFGGDTTWIDVRVDPDGDGARLQLTHAAIPGDHWGQFGPGAVGIGWDLSLLGLSDHLAGRPRVADDWMTGPDAARFVRASNESWCNADIESGTPDDAARTAADNTLAAYLPPG